jgi:hypothetical protein
MPVPHAWLEGYGLVAAGGADPEAAAQTDSDGDGHLAWQEYVAGTEPTDPASVFTVHIALSSGAAQVSWVPDLRSDRVYAVEGKSSLDALWAPTNAASRFFRVKVATAPMDP